MAIPTPQDLMTSLQSAQTALNAKTGKNTPLPTITASDLTTQKPANITPPAPATQGVGLAGAIQQSTDAFTQQLQADKKAKEAALVQPRTDIQDFLKNLRGETELTAEAYAQKGGVDAVDLELKDINNQILQEQVGLQRQIEKLEKNPQGMLAGALEDQINDVQRESIRKRADLSVIQMGIQGRYDSAKAIADRAVSAYMEKQKNEYEALKFNYEDNKELFTRAEQREFEVMADNRKRELDAKSEDMSNMYRLGIELSKAGAGSGVVSAMLSENDPITALAKYGSALYVPPAAKTIELIGGLTKEQRASLNTIQDNARQDINIKEFPAIRASYETARSAASTKSGAGDIVLMRMIAKITDPTTGVREEEFRTFEGAQSTLSRYGVKLTKQMWEGDRLSDAGRESLLAQVNDVYSQRKSAYDSSYEFYDNQATGWGLPEKSVMPYYAAPIKEEQKVSQAEINSYKSQLSPGEILVRDKQSGAIGAIPFKENDESKYDVLGMNLGIKYYKNYGI